MHFKFFKKSFLISFFTILILSSAAVGKSVKGNFDEISKGISSQCKNSDCLKNNVFSDILMQNQKKFETLSKQSNTSDAEKIQFSGASEVIQKITDDLKADKSCDSIKSELTLLFGDRSDNSHDPEFLKFGFIALESHCK